MDYYWSGYQTEWATDVLFKSPGALAAVYPALVQHAMQHFKSPDVMRFLGKKVSGNFLGELTNSFKDRPEGVRAKPIRRQHAEGPAARWRSRRWPSGPRCTSRGTRY
ncbi:MAG: hypothetical protein ACYC8T_34075 [Myxococcaceae bacterium]